MKLLNKTGIMAIEVLLLIGMVSALTLGVKETKDNGVLKNNGKKIWCKMQNKGAAYCDAQYPTP